MENDIILYKLKMTSIFIGRRPSKKTMQPKTNKANCYNILKNSTVTSRQPDQHNNQKYIGTIKKKYQINLNWL